MVATEAKPLTASQDRGGRPRGLAQVSTAWKRLLDLALAGSCQGHPQDRGFERPWRHRQSPFRRSWPSGNG